MALSSNPQLRKRQLANLRRPNASEEEVTRLLAEIHDLYARQLARCPKPLKNQLSPRELLELALQDHDSPASRAVSRGLKQLHDDEVAELLDRYQLPDEDEVAELLEASRRP